MTAIINYLSSFFLKIASVFSTFGFKDFIDILFIAVLIYGCIRIVRETRAFQLIKGILILAIIYAVVKVFAMESSTYILNKVFSNGILIVVILFSTEFRHALEQIGKANVSKLGFFKFVNTEFQQKNARHNSLISATCRACSQLSDQNIGALIVFEKVVLLGEVIETGTVLDATASSELISNVFFPKSPLHDGAMVTRDGKVFAAGCILPLTKNNAVSSSLGTRHRAALGISELSDAVVIVVSEETGAISVAKSGKLRQNLSDGDLRDILTTEFLAPESDDKETFASKIKRRLGK